MRILQDESRITDLRNVLIQFLNTYGLNAQAILMITLRSGMALGEVDLFAILMGRGKSYQMLVQILQCRGFYNRAVAVQGRDVRRR